MYLLIISLPILGSFVTGMFGRFLGFRGAALISTACVGLAALCSSIAFYEVALSGSPCSIALAPWFVSEIFEAQWGFYFDTLTVVMLFVITSISTLVHLYSLSYMEQDPHIPRFLSYLSIFTFFMIMLVTADNFVQMFFGWEGVGLASYLLINFWFTRLQASKASIKAMLVNRVGDFGLALGIFGLFSLFKTTEFASIFPCVPLAMDQTFVFCTVELHALTCICLLLFVGAIGKSAQLGLHTWLPDAMEGPTPVSALIHAATMVTAGVFMLARCSPIFEYAPSALTCVAVLGAMTCFFAGTVGVVQNDLKRVIAYSTASQLGYMVFVCGLSHYAVGVFHLFNHAFFKALLFLSAGSVIHALSDEQDMRKMGGLGQLLPFTFSMMTIGSLALVGFPFLTGFYSKDVILEIAAAKYSLSGNFCYFFGSCVVFLTSYYSFRVIVLTFLGKNTAYKTSMKHVHDAPILLAIPLLLLAFGSIFGGYLAKDMMIGVGTQFWSNALFVLPDNNVLVESEYISQTQKLLPLFSTLAGAFLAYAVNSSWVASIYTFKVASMGRALYTFLNKRWFFDKVYNDYISQPALNFGYQISFKTLDKGSFEILGPSGIAATALKITQYFTRLQSGMIYHYAVVMLFGLVVFVTFGSFWDVLDTLIDPRFYILYACSFFIFHFYTGEKSIRTVQ